MSFKSITGVSKKDNTQGVSEAEVINSESEIHYENIVRNGFSTIKNVFSKETCDLAKKKNRSNL